MNLRIMLTSFSLTYMYGDRVYGYPFLLSREVIKKAYNEGLYFISSEKNIEDILNNPEKKRSILVFAGIPTFQAVCVDLSPRKELTALKIKLPYEELAKFTYKKETKQTLENKEMTIPKDSLEKVNLYLTFQNNELEYLEKNLENLEENEEEILKYFAKEMESFRFAILNKVEYLKEKLESFLSSNVSKEFYEQEENLKMIKECYEELF